MVPFFVADRPMSLRILKGLPLMDYPQVRMGIMAHANTSKSFQEQFRQYPCKDLDYCEAARGSCKYRNGRIDECPYRQHILENTIKMCDSGIFTREGATLSYTELFQVYENMGVEYGIMIDVFRDSVKTIESAKQGKTIYEKGTYTFKFVAVAQGQTVEEYIDCYRALRDDLRFEHIAIGGLLQRQQNTVRFARVENEEERMFRILKTLRALYPNDWLFALGSFSPNRIEKFEELNVWADHKGWIFNYKKRNESLDKDIQNLAINHLSCVAEQSKVITQLKQIVEQRSLFAQEKKSLSKAIILERNALRKELNFIYQKLVLALPDLAEQFDEVITQSILTNSEKKLVIEAFEKLKFQSSKKEKTLDMISRSFELNEMFKAIEIKLNEINKNLTENLQNILLVKVELPTQTQELLEKIISVIQKDEQSHRVEQVQAHVAKKVFMKISQLKDRLNSSQKAGNVS